MGRRKREGGRRREGGERGKRERERKREREGVREEQRAGEKGHTCTGTLFGYLVTASPAASALHQKSVGGGGE